MTTVEWVACVWIGVINLVAFIAHGLDKRAAIRGTRRTPEARLHLWELLGGWPAAFVAMMLFRHKTRKLSYLVVSWAIAAIWIGAMIWWWTRSPGA